MERALLILWLLVLQYSFQDTSENEAQFRTPNLGLLRRRPDYKRRDPKERWIPNESGYPPVSQSRPESRNLKLDQLPKEVFDAILDFVDEKISHYFSNGNKPDKKKKDKKREKERQKEKERQEKEMQEKERQEKEMQEKERQKKARQERERQERERQESERQESERQERERQERERQEMERHEKERLEMERREKERQKEKERDKNVRTSTTERTTASKKTRNKSPFIDDIPIRDMNIWTPQIVDFIKPKPYIKSQL